MTIPVVILAGGKGTRLGCAEKPLVAVGGTAMVERVVAAARAAGVASPVVATSRWTPATERHVRDLGFAVLRTPGRGYVPDVAWLAGKVGRFVSVASDLPFIPPRELRRFLSFARAGEGSVTGVVMGHAVPPGMPHGPEWHKGDAGHVCHAVGVNVVDPGGGQEDREYVFEEALIGASVNTPQDLRWARAYADLGGRSGRAPG